MGGGGSASRALEGIDGEGESNLYADNVTDGGKATSKSLLTRFFSSSSSLHQGVLNRASNKP